MFLFLFLTAILTFTLASCAKTPQDNEPRKYAVKFYADGVIVREIETDGNEIIQLPTAPAKDGYDFDGWFFNIELTEEVKQLINIKDNISVYAKFTEKQYTVTYNLDGGENAPSNPTSYTITTEDITLQDPIKEGYVFEGWYAESNFITKISDIPRGSHAPVNLYAKWKAIEYKITYVLDGGVNNSQNPQKLTSSDMVRLLEPSKQGFIFKGWYSEQEFITKVENIYGSQKADVAVYARWELITYTITYELDGGTNHKDNVDSFIITDNIITLLDASKEHYTFLGWYLDSDYTERIVSIDASVATDITLYAKWDYIEREREVSFVLNYSGSSVVKRLTENGKITYIPEREGYVFNGWWLSDGSTSEGYILSKKYDIDQFVTTDNLVLYAEWVELSTTAKELHAPTVGLMEHTLEWNAVEGAVAYDVIVLFGGNEVKNERITQTNIVFTDDYEAGYYTVKIRSVGDGINSVNSAFVSKLFAYKMLTAITGVEFDINASVVSWNPVRNAESYDVYVDNYLVKTVSESFYDLSSLAAGNHTVKIVAKKTGYVSSSAMKTVNKRRLLSPKGVSVYLIDDGQLKYVITWDKVTNADLYILTFGNETISTSETTYIVDGNNEYYNGGLLEFTIQAFDTNTDYLISANENVSIQSNYYKLSIVSDGNDSAKTIVSGEMFASSSEIDTTYLPAEHSEFSTVYFIDGKSVTVSAQSPEPFVFDGWYDGDTLLSTESSFTFVMPQRNYALTTKWKCYTLTATTGGADSLLKQSDIIVTFLYNDRTGRSLTRVVTDLDSLVCPAPPTREGYLFTGWYSDNECLNYYDFSSDIVQNINLYAGWYKINQEAGSYFTPDFINQYNKENPFDFYMGKNEEKYIYFKCLTYGSEVQDVMLDIHIEDWNGLDIEVVNAKTGESYYVEYYRSWYDFTIDISKKLNLDNGDIVYIKFYNQVKYRHHISLSVRNLHQHSGGRINDVDRIEEIVAVGKQVTLKTWQKDGYAFAGWYNGNEFLSNELTYTHTMTANDTEVVAKYIRCPVTLEQTISEAGSVSGVKKIILGKEATITATLNDGYAFIGWYNGNDLLTKDLSYTFIVTENPVTYTARYEIYSLTTVVNDDNAGSIEQTYHNEKITPDKVLTLKANTVDGYTFTGWYKGDELLSLKTEFEFTMPYSNVELTAKWILCPIQILLNDETYGAVHDLPTKTVCGETYTLYASVNTGYIFEGWYDGETLLQRGQYYSFVMTEEKRIITAKWIPYTIKLNCEIDNVSVAGNQNEAGSLREPFYVRHVGQEVTFSAFVNDGYTFIGYYDGDEQLCQSGDYVMSIPDKETTITAKWLKNALVLAKNIDEAGTVAANETKLFAGKQYTVTAQTNKGYNFLGWYNNETLLSKQSAYEFTMISDYLTLTAKWSCYTLTAKVYNEEHGSLEQTYDNKIITVGEAVRVSAISNEGYTFDGWYDENTGELLSSEAEYEFVMPAANVSLVAKWAVYTITFQESEGADVYVSKAFSVAFDVNGGMGDIPTQYVSYYNPLVYPDVIPEKYSCVFMGWYLKGSDTPYDFTSKITQNLTLIAGWYEIPNLSKYNYIDFINPVVERNSKSTAISRQHMNAVKSTPNTCFFAALSSTCVYNFYYKAETDDPNYGTYFSIYNVTQGKDILKEKLCYNSSYNIPFGFYANAGDVIRVDAYCRNYRYQSSYDFYIEGATYPSDGGFSDLLNVTYDESVRFNVGDYLDIKTVIKPGYTFNSFYCCGEAWTSDKRFLFQMENWDATFSVDCVKYTLTVKSTEGGKANVYYDAIVNFDLNGGFGNVKSQTITREQNLVYPEEIPTKPGYIFTGWYTTPDCKTLYTFSSDIVGDITLFAGYSKIENQSNKINIIDITKYNDTNNFYTRSNKGTSEGNAQYTYFSIPESGKYTFVFTAAAEKSDNDVKVYYKVVNQTKNTDITRLTLIEASFQMRTEFNADAGDIIYVECYRYTNATSYNCNYGICVEGIKKPSAEGVLHAADGDSIAIPEYRRVTIVFLPDEGYKFIGAYESESGTISFKTEVTTFEMMYYHDGVSFEARWQKL